EGHPRVAVFLSGMVNRGGREIDAAHAAAGAPLGQGEREAAGPTADIQDRLAILCAGEIQERQGEATAPATHRQLVAVAVGRHEGRGGCRHPIQLLCSSVLRAIVSRHHRPLTPYRATAVDLGASRRGYAEVISARDGLWLSSRARRWPWRATGSR